MAWFTASTKSEISTYTPDTTGLTTKAGSAQLGKFEVKAVPQGFLNDIELTTDAGKSYVFTSGEVGSAGVEKVEVPVTDGVRTVDVKLQVIYNSISDEAAKTAEEILTIWKETIGSKTIGIKGTSDKKVRFLSSSAPADASAWAGTVGTTGVTYTVSNENLIGLAFGGCAGNGAKSNSKSNADAESDFYVAVTGDDTNVETAVNHTLTFTPQTAA